jgi:hypothetical protein
VRTIEDLDAIRDELIGMPVLLRVWLELVQNTYTGAEEVRWEGRCHVAAFLHSDWLIDRLIELLFSL